MVYWRIKAGAHAAAHKHPHEEFVWMVKGTMDFRIGNEKRTMKPGDVAVIPGGVALVQPRHEPGGKLPALVPVCRPEYAQRQRHHDVIVRRRARGPRGPTARAQ